MSKTNKAVVFPGQGAQRPGMGQDFDQISEIAKSIFDTASEATKVDMRELCFTENDKVNLTEYTQPAILTTEIAMFNTIQSKYNFQPSFFAGHSLGEYAALVAADVIDFRDAVQIVRKRGALMQSAVPEGVGAMAALLFENIESTSFKAITEAAGAEVANYNSSNQVVISGKTAAIETAAKNLQSEYPEMKIIMLAVSAPFHSSHMKTIESEFKDFLMKYASNFRLQNSSRVISNFSGSFHTPEKLIENMVKQISGSVRWTENMRLMAEKCETIIEIGPNKVLTKFFSTIGVTVPAIFNEKSAAKAFENQ